MFNTSELLSNPRRSPSSGTPPSKTVLSARLPPFPTISSTLVRTASSRPDGMKLREVLKRPDWLEEVENQLRYTWRTQADGYASSTRRWRWRE